MKRYRRHLPHWDYPGLPVFVTWRLRGSLPAERVFLPEHLTSGEAFLAWDRLLDEAHSGPVYLRQPEIAAVVRDNLREMSACSLHAYVIMPNHVHVLCTPRTELRELMRRLKGPTACLANKLLSRTGKPFWQEEYFDRIVRDDKEFVRIRRYIEWNPVRAGLVTRPEDFPWSSATKPSSQAEGGLQPASSFSSTLQRSSSEADLYSGAEAPRRLKPALL